MDTKCWGRKALISSRKKGEREKKNKKGKRPTIRSLPSDSAEETLLDQSPARKQNGDRTRGCRAGGAVGGAVRKKPAEKKGEASSLPERPGRRERDGTRKGLPSGDSQEVPPPPGKKGRPHHPKRNSPPAGRGTMLSAQWATAPVAPDPKRKVDDTKKEQEGAVACVHPRPHEQK